MTRNTDDRTRFGFSSLLVPVDLTSASDRVLRRVALLPLARKARLTLLHVVPSSLPLPDRHRAKRDAKRALGEEVLHLASSVPSDIKIVPAVSVGAVASEIDAYSERTAAEMIVMGRGGGRVLRETFLGSTAERVIRRTQRPVLVGGRFRGINPDALALGNSNIGGLGLLAEGSWERPRGYRTGAHCYARRNLRV